MDRLTQEQADELVYSATCPVTGDLREALHAAFRLGLAQNAERVERAHLQTIDERDAAEEALSQAYYLITGESPEWSNNFGKEAALEQIDDAQRMLRETVKQAESRLATLTEKARALLESLDEQSRACPRGVWRDDNTADRVQSAVRLARIALRACLE